MIGSEWCRKFKAFYFSATLAGISFIELPILHLFGFYQKSLIMSLEQHYITICPDIGCYLQFEDGSCDGYYDDRISNEESDHMPWFSFIVPGLSEWHLAL